MTIGFFDSGVGGISVLEEAVSSIPGQRWLFDADADHVPYGERSPEEIGRYAAENARFLLSQGADAIVVACNTATAVAIGALRELCPVPVIGMEPAVKPAVEELGAGEDPVRAQGVSGRVLVTATPVTLRESKLRDLLHRVDRFHRVDLLALPGLVPLAERELYDSEEAEGYLRDALAGIEPGNYAALVLGCTHFIYFKPLFRRLLGDGVHLIDGNRGTVRRLASVLELPLAEGAGDGAPDVRWFRSGRELLDPDEIRRCGRFLARAGAVR